MADNNTQERFKEELIKFQKTIDESSVTFSDASRMYSLCVNLFLRYEEVYKSRESWKKKYKELKKNEK